MPVGDRGIRVCASKLLVVLAIGHALGCPRGVNAQSNTRLLLSSGWGVPDHAGFVFGPFSNLAMNGAKEITFLSTLRGSKSDLRAVMRSAGVTFSVVAFEGLRAPVPKASYESFSAPSLNDAGVIAFTATFKEREEAPPAAVIRVEGAYPLAVATAGSRVPGHPDATFQEFSAPVIDSKGNILFGARTDGKQPGTGLFLWTPRGIQAVSLPAGLNLAPKDLLVPAFSSHDEAVFVSRGTPMESVKEQFFRAAALKNFQELNPAPRAGEIVQALAGRPSEAPVKLLLVVMEGEKVQAAVLEGDPSQPVVAKRSGGGLSKPLGRIQGQSVGARGNIIFAAAPEDQPADLALFCFCNGRVVRVTSPEEFLPITEAAGGKPIVSLVGDSQNTVAFIAANIEGTDSVAIYVTSVP